MCRYDFTRIYKDHYVCFSCRESKKARKSAECPQCRQPMQNVFKDYRVPKKTDKVGWDVMRILRSKGYIRPTCGCTGLGLLPTSLWEARALPPHPRLTHLRKRGIL